MTAQVPESLIFQGAQHNMFAEPLESYFSTGAERPNFAAMTTACWRGYEAEWEVDGDRLYLVKLTGVVWDGPPVTVASLFPDTPERAFAHWFSGTVRLPRGEQIQYVHMGYESVYEQDLLLEFDRGVLVRTQMRVNSSRDTQAPRP
jgi:hypothetical protein